MSETPTLLMPQWTEDDFYNETVYKWLWEHKDEKFAFQRCFALTQRQAKAFHVAAFVKMWNAYVQAMSPRQQVLGVNATDFPDQPIQLQSGKYICDYDGVHYEGRMGECVWVCKHPIMPVKRIVNVENGYESTEVAYRRGNMKWRTLIAGSETLASAQKIIGLAKSGIAVNSENAKEMVKYITDMVSDNIADIPIQSSTSRLGWMPDGQFVPYAEGIEYDGESPENMRMYAAFQETGSYDTWLNVAKAARSGESVAARIALAGSFAAPLVSKLNALPFIIHLYGASGMGKSVGLMLSASVWAEPTVGGAYIKTFGGTKVSLELMATFCGNTPLYLDELQIVKDRKQFDDIIYMLCEGASKGRGAKDGGLQTQRTWSNCILTTGEMPIVQGNSGGGASVRTIEVDYGGIPFFPDSREVANTLKANYGFAGRMFIDGLSQPGMIEKVRQAQKKFEVILSEGDIHGKQVLSASILLAADQIADELIFHDGKSLTPEEIEPYLVTNQQADANERCYQWLVGYIGANPRRFETEDNNGELWGKKEDNCVYIIRTIFDRILQTEGYSASTFLTWAKRNRKIQCEDYSDGKNQRLTKRKTINGTTLTCVALYMPNDDGYVEVVDDGMPF